MNLLHLDYFRTVARFKSVTRAAEELHISQPALSNTLRRLEQELGIKLFERHGRALILSKDGQEFLKSVNSIFSLLGRKHQLSNLSGIEDCSEITIGSYRTESQLTEYMSEYSDKHPNVLFRILSHTRLDNSQAIDEVDFLVSPQIKELSKRHKCRLSNSEQFVVLPADHPLSANDIVDISELSTASQIIVTPPDILMPHSLSLALRAGLSPNVRFITEDRFSALCILLQGNHIMLMPKEDALNICNRMENKLAARPIASDSLPVDWQNEVYLSWKDLDDMSESSRDFLRFLFDRMHLVEL